MHLSHIVYLDTTIIIGLDDKIVSSMVLFSDKDQIIKAPTDAFKEPNMSKLKVILMQQ